MIELLLKHRFVERKIRKLVKVRQLEIVRINHAAVTTPVLNSMLPLNKLRKECMIGPHDKTTSEERWSYTLQCIHNMEIYLCLLIIYNYIFYVLLYINTYFFMLCILVCWHELRIIWFVVKGKFGVGKTENGRRGSSKVKTKTQNDNSSGSTMITLVPVCDYVWVCAQLN